MAVNCWQFKGCGRQPGGSRVNECGVCPASTATEHDGVNDGTNGGRYCWRVAGTLCGGKVAGSVAAKQQNCVACEFFNKVMREQRQQQVTKQAV